MEEIQEYILDKDEIERKEYEEYKEKGYTTKSKFEDKYIMTKETDTYEPSYTNPIISITITAMGRLRIHEEEKKIPQENKIYKDTDSLLFEDPTGEILKRFKIGKELGEWKIEKDEDGTPMINKPCKVLGEKRYYVGNKVKISGLQKKERTINVIEKEENIKIKRIYGLGSAFENGQWEKVGGFQEMEMEMKSHSKNMLPTPDYINEVKRELKENDLVIEITKGTEEI